MLCAAGAAKLYARAGTPILAIAELAVGGGCLISQLFAAALVLAAAYLALAVVALARRRAGEPCACFGAERRAPTPLHVALNLVFAATGVLASAWSPEPPGSGTVAVAIGLALLAILAYQEGIPAERAALALGSWIEARTTRRGALARATVAGTALAVAPVRYLLRPGTAWAVIRPGHCGGGPCTDGYTAFCCEIQQGSNRCPPHTYPAGWWMCTSYGGGGLCSSEGVRYYIDCNRTPGQSFPGGCQCANGDCGARRVDCNHFRYGQCNAQVAGTTEVVCRLMVCQNPATIPGMNCNGTVAVDNNTCYHEAGCLHGLAAQLPGGVGV